MDTARRTRAGGSAAFRFVAAGVSVQLITLGITTALWLGLHLTEVKFARDVVLGGVVFTALVLLAVSPVLTVAQWNRLRGVDLPPVTARRWTWRGLTVTGRQLGYHAKPLWIHTAIFSEPVLDGSAQGISKGAGDGGPSPLSGSTTVLGASLSRTSSYLPTASRSRPTDPRCCPPTGQDQGLQLVLGSP
ncbi:hypothetical protein AB0M80_10600 [Amycolatopsis sp. NPDC051045]|uniref:hypothetical protein n=1 Tax=Amycolatopsis sp. NPDC051045 TaxID=3156922 RepID=UPI0034338C04